MSRKEQILVSEEDFFEVVLQTGKLLLMYGAETYRVEETMKLLAEKVNPHCQVHTFVTPTGIILTIANEQRQRTQLVRIRERGIDLHKVAEINELSRKFMTNSLNRNELALRLLQIERGRSLYGPLLLHFAAGIASGCFAYLFGGTLKDFGSAFIAGSIVNLSFLFLLKMIQVKFVAELLSSLTAGLLTVFLYYGVGIGENFNMIIIGSLMPLVPGVPITNSIHDMMAGDLVAGVAKGVEALLTALAVATGVAVVITFRMGLLL